MAVTAGNYGAILSNGAGREPSGAPDFVEVFTEGWFAGIDTGAFPPVEIEVLYPIVPQAASSNIVFRRDNSGWAKVQKSSATWRQEIISLGIQVRHSNFAALWAFLLANKALAVTLNIPGVQPFIRAAEENTCYLLDWSEPEPVYPFVYKMNITFLRVQL